MCMHWLQLNSEVQHVTCCVDATVWSRTQDCDTGRKTREKTELPHVFLKCKNEKTYMETKGKRDMEKRATAAGEGMERETVVVGSKGAYKPNGHVNGERQATLTLFFFFAHCVLCSCCCVFSLMPAPPSLPAPVFLFCFLWLAKLAKVHCFSRTVLEGLKKLNYAVKLSILSSIWDRERLEMEIYDWNNWKLLAMSHL